jgi:hypothetical protein
MAAVMEKSILGTLVLNQGNINGRPKPPHRNWRKQQQWQLLNENHFDDVMK